MVAARAVKLPPQQRTRQLPVPSVHTSRDGELERLKTGDIIAVARWQTGRWRLVAEAGCGGLIPEFQLSQSEDRWLVAEVSDDPL